MQKAKITLEQLEKPLKILHENDKAICQVKSSSYGKLGNF